MKWASMHDVVHSERASDEVSRSTCFAWMDLNQPRPQGFSLKKTGGAGKGPGIDWSRVLSYTLKSWV